ncbi:MAG: FtsH protease activity modulator HflK [Thiotrichales bacterium]
MPWNQPGGDNQDPWGGGKRGNQGPPDLDEMFKKLSDKLGGFGKGGGGSEGGPGRGAATGLAGIAILVFIVWAASGFYIVGEGERGLVLRFGAFQSVADPGPHWHLPTPFETVEMVDIDQVRSFQHRSSMLTQDENIVDIELAAQYRIKDPEAYVFRVRDPDASLHEAVESALREAVGKNKMDFVLNEGRPQVASLTKDVTQSMLDAYDTGLEVTTVNLQQIQPPEQVQDAFNDAIKAREDNVRFINEAEAYSNSIIPQARGEAARVTEEAAAYREQMIAQAEGDAARFSQLLSEYKKAPAVTRERLYLETVESVLSSSSKVMMDAQQGNSLMYLPLDKLIQSSPSSSTAGSSMPQSAPSPISSSSSAPARTTRSTRTERTTIRESR